MSVDTWFLFILVTIAAIACPGPAIVLAVSNALSYQIRAVFFQTLGNLLGLLVVTSVVVLGLGNLLESSPETFRAVKYCGAGYIILMGVRRLISNNPMFAKLVSRSNTGRKNSIVTFFEGLLVALANPQTLIFFIAVFPSFLDLSVPLMPQYIILTASVLVISFASLMTYGYLTHRAKDLLECPRRMNILQRLLGIFMMLLGLGLLTVPTQSSTGNNGPAPTISILDNLADTLGLGIL